MPKANRAPKTAPKTAPAKDTTESFGSNDTQFHGTVSGYVLGVEDIVVKGAVKGKRIKLRPMSQGWCSPARGEYKASIGSRKTWPVIEVWGQAVRLLDPNLGKGDWLQASQIFPTVSSWIGKDADGEDAAFAALVFRTEHPPLVILAPGEEEELPGEAPEDDESPS